MNKREKIPSFWAYNSNLDFSKISLDFILFFAFIE